VCEDSNTITCNIMELTVSNASVRFGEEEIPSSSISENTESEQGSSQSNLAFLLVYFAVTFTFPSNFPKGSKLTLKLVFNAPLNATNAGFYKSKFTHEGKS
jgi:hypothetical protein